MGKKPSVKNRSAIINSSKQTHSGDWSLDRVLILIIKSMTYLALFTPLIVVSDFFFPFVGPKSIVFMGSVQILTAAYILLIIYYPDYRPKLNILTIAVFSYLAVILLTTLTGVNPERSFWSNHERMTGLLMWFHLTAFFVVISSVFKSQRDWRDIFAVSISAAAIVGTISLLALTRIIDFAGAWGGSTIGNTSFMGVYLLFNAFIAIYLFLKSQFILKYYSVVIFLLIGLALFVSDAIASILGFLIGLALIFLLYPVCMSEKKYIKATGIAVIAISVVAAIALGVLLFVPGSIVRQEFIRLDTEARLTAWAVSWRGFTERPWLGWGRENLQIPFMRHFDSRLYLPEHGAETWFDRAHNIVLDTLISSGIFGLLAYMAIFIAAFILLWKHFLREKVDFWLAAIFTSALIAYFIQNLTVFDMINSYLMFMLLLGFISSLPLADKTSHARKKACSFALPRVASVLIAFLLIFYFFIITPWGAGSAVSRALRPASFDEMLYFYGRAIGDSPLGRADVRLFLTEQFQTFSMSEEGLQADRNVLDRVFRYLEGEMSQNIRENPMDYKSHIAFAQFYNTWAQFDRSKAYRAKSMLDEAIRISPTNQLNYWVLTDTHFLLNEHDEALKAAEKAIALEPRLLRSHEIIVRVAVGMGDIERAEEKINRALEINPDWEEHLNSFIKH
jgi:O-antigen ligase